jgi:hypothetical protein
MRSISALNDTNYGVHFESDKITVFAGDIFVTGDPTNKVVDLPDGIEIFVDNIDLAGNPTANGYNLIFDRLTGTTNNSGTIEIRLVKDTDKIKQVVINSEGQIDYASFKTSSGSPIINARHVHYDLGWNIENSTILRLEWTGGFGAVTNDIDATAYFNADKSEFDWYGTTNVDGSDQSLRIHSWLNGGNTILCIIRDQTEEYALDVYFVDGGTTKKITTYKNNEGIISVTPNSFYVWGTTIIK